MEQIKHNHVEVRGIKLHVAEIGTGPKVVLFVHGFPEIWYSWRHQMIAAANAGYRAIALDCRGYGLSDHSPVPEETTFDDFLEDIVALLDTLGIDKVFLVGKDAGVLPVYQLAVVHPKRVLGVFTLGIPFILPGPLGLQTHLFPKGFYILRWMEPGRAEADFGRFDVKTVIRKIYIMFSGSELQVAGEDQEIMDLVDSSTPLPPWFTEDDLAIYASSYEKSGFRTALRVPYRTLTRDCGITNPKITAPSVLIMGEQDYVMKFPGMEDYMRSGKVKEFVPDLDIKFLPEGNHFVQEKLPEEVGRSKLQPMIKRFWTSIYVLYLNICKMVLNWARNDIHELDYLYFLFFTDCRSSHIDCGITDPKITAPSLLIMGEKDYFMKFPGMEDYMRSGYVKQFMPDLDIVFMPEGNHFV